MIGTYHNIFRIGAILQDLGFWILNDVIWRKSNPMPNFRGRRFTNAHETLLWCAADSEARYTFNYEAMKALNDDLQMRSDWLIPLCGGPERLRDGDGPEGAPDAEARGAAAPRAARLDPAGRHRARPVFRHRHDRRGRQAAGAPLYRHRARPRLCRGRAAAHRRGPAGAGRARRLESRREAPRVPFGSLVERGLLAPGEVLVDQPALERAGARRRQPDLGRASRLDPLGRRRAARARRPATAGPSGMSSARASWC